MNNLETFLSKYENEKTIKTFTWVLGSFSKSIYGNKKDLSQKLEQYLSEKRNHEEDVTNFYISLNGKPPLSKRLMISNLKTFLAENEVELSKRFWVRLRSRNKKQNGNRAVTLDEIPEDKQLRQIFTHLNAKGKALYFVLESSGMRIGETLQLLLDDVDLETVPTKIRIRQETTKTGTARFAFISSEATEALKEWLKIREESFEAIIKRSNKRRKVKINKDRIFPFEFSNATFMWNSALRKAKLDKRDGTTKRHIYHPHVLRKFFRTKMATVIPVDVVEALMGHEGYLTEVYRRYTAKDLAKFYVRGEHTVAVFGNVGELTKIKGELETEKNDLTMRNIAFQKWFIEVKQENIELKKSNEELTSQMEKFREEIKSIVDMNYKEFQGFREWVETKERVEEQKDVLEERKEILKEKT